MARDSLRATLDELKLDENAAKDRPYLEAMLRRLGYTETEIRAELGPPVEATPAPAQDFGGDDGVAPNREYRLVVPARESAFSFEDPNAPRGPDSPFEAFERVEFEESAPAEETVEFSEVAQEPVQEFEPVPELEETSVAAVDTAPSEVTEFEEAPLAEFQGEPVEELQAEQSTPVEDIPLDTFGGPEGAGAPRTRVRVKRVRAKSKAEAEAKVASKNRRVIKSIPVDIVERWGDKKGGN